MAAPPPLLALAPTTGFNILSDPFVVLGPFDVPTKWVWDAVYSGKGFDSSKATGALHAYTGPKGIKVKLLWYDSTEHLDSWMLAASTKQDSNERTYALPKNEQAVFALDTTNEHATTTERKLVVTRVA